MLAQPGKPNNPQRVAQSSEQHQEGTKVTSCYIWIMCAKLLYWSLKSLGGARSVLTGAAGSAAWAQLGPTRVQTLLCEPGQLLVEPSL